MRICVDLFKKSKNRKMNVGYTTMTGDLLHPGHIRFLKNAKQLCSTLVVGLTTDRLASKQKRVPWFSFQHRREVISSLECVDSVVEHDGDSKLVAHKKLGFHSLFIGEDYFEKKEYVDVERELPHVRVYYLPRTTGICSSRIIDSFFDRFIRTSSFERYAIGGPVMSFGNDSVVCKIIKLGAKECQTSSTGDVYNIAIPPPRNWKGKESEHVFPMISGVNGNRELMVHDVVSKFPWNPYISRQLMYTNNRFEVCSPSDGRNNIDIMQAERASPTSVWWLVQKHCGHTLIDHMVDKTSLYFKENILPQVRRICDDLESVGVVHGDIHATNLCVSQDGVVSLVDFGWCMSDMFDMVPNEHDYYLDCLQNDFDWKHFVTSLPSHNLDYMDTILEEEEV